VPFLGLLNGVGFCDFCFLQAVTNGAINDESEITLILIFGGLGLAPERFPFFVSPGQAELSLLQ
jgi:hypothetical protein